MEPGVSINKYRKHFLKNNPFLFLVFTILILVSILKISFYYYNYSVLFYGSSHSGFRLVAWSLSYDLFTILLINFPFLVLLIATKKIPGKIVQLIVRIIFCAFNAFMLILNTVDVFYYQFHFQRSNIDLFYVIDHPVQKMANISFLTLAGCFLVLLIIIIITWRVQNLFYFSLMKKSNYKTAYIIMAVVLIALIFPQFQLSRKIVPTYPLIDLNSNELSVVQNSMDTFIYSLYRNNHAVLDRKYFSDSFCDSALPIKKVFKLDENVPPKNIVLFIMESIPEDFFDSSDIFKVRMPFFDSLLHHSIYFSNAYSYGRESNKGITSILAGIPTLTDIPLYHSSFVNLPKTSVGNTLKSKKYNSFFCIGDTYDNFGFAKCVYWLGFDKYYCNRDIPGFEKLLKGPMGIYDQYVLEFMRQKINSTGQPFLAVNYNTTTHYPNTLPQDFRKKMPKNYTDAMKSMSYYDSCLHVFFNASQNESWFKNTVFIFCADHWMSPDNFKSPFNNLSGFKIPIIIYEPSVNEEIKNISLVSQFDVLGTMLGIAGYSDTTISYGGNLLDTNIDARKNVIFNRVSNSLYQVVDSSYVLGFNVADNKTEYLYNYKEDKNLQNNLVDNSSYLGIRNSLIDKVKVFFQKAVNQYFSKPFQ